MKQTRFFLRTILFKKNVALENTMFAPCLKDVFWNAWTYICIYYPQENNNLILLDLSTVYKACITFLNIGHAAFCCDVISLPAMSELSSAQVLEWMNGYIDGPSFFFLFAFNNQVTVMCTCSMFSSVWKAVVYTRASCGWEDLRLSWYMCRCKDLGLLFPALAIRTTQDCHSGFPVGALVSSAVKNHTG